MEKVDMGIANKRGAVLHAALALILLSLLAGCAKPPPGQAYDPLEKGNRAFYAFNDVLDRILLKPLSTGYIKITPRPIRASVSNFFENIGYANTILNDFLQGKGGQGFRDLTRMLVNTTLGIGGLFDVASNMGLEKHEEDLGQTLGVWGAPSGAYLVYPVIGPSTVRDTPDLAAKTFTSGLYWMAQYVSSTIMWPIYILGIIDQRSRAENAIRFVNEMALDPYLFTREGWLQHREYLIYDGNPPAPELGDEFDFEEEPTPEEEGARIDKQSRLQLDHKWSLAYLPGTPAYALAQAGTETLNGFAVAPSPAYVVSSSR